MPSNSGELVMPPSNRRELGTSPLNWMKKRGFALSFAVLYILFFMFNLSLLNLSVEMGEGYIRGVLKPETPKNPKGGSRHLNIAVLSSFIPSTMWSDALGKIKKMSDHILNRECYCHLWNYECIFNQTMEMGLYVDGGSRYDEYNSSLSKAKNPWWLQFAGWERVAHLQAALPNYDWVLYGDLDYIIKDMSRPIESFIREFELYGKNDIHVLVPRDDNKNDGIFTFSSFSILIKNSPFGRRLVENWRAFGMGLCPNGNFEDKSKEQKYFWGHCDQVGLWYALMKTHNDFRPGNLGKLPDTVKCNENTGLLNGNYWIGMQNYFRKNGYTVGNYGIMLNEIDDHQMIAWSKTQNDSMSGLGVNLNFFPGAAQFAVNAFALHNQESSNNWDREMQIELGMCKMVHGCSVTWNEKTGIRTGCEGNSTRVVGNPGSTDTNMPTMTREEQKT